MKKYLLVIPLFFLLCFVVGCQDKAAMAELDEFRAQAAVEEQNKEIAKRFVEEENKGDAENNEVFKGLQAPDLSYYFPSNIPKPMSLNEAIESLKPIFEAFPDAVWSIEDLIAAGDKVIVRFVLRGTHEGEFMGIPPTGKKVEVGGMAIMRIENGKIVEVWEDADVLGWMMQLGMELKPKEAGK
jgi:steroid delta-isomerase-like uncharacterized protein